MHKRIIVPLIAALLALAVLAVPAFASPVLFCTMTVANATTTTLTFPNDCGGGSFGASYNNLRIVGEVANDSVVLDYTPLDIRLNGDATSHYDFMYTHAAGTSVSTATGNNQTSGTVALIPGRKAGYLPHMAAAFELEIPDFNGTVFDKYVIEHSALQLGSTSTLYTEFYTTVWRPATSVAITTVTLFPASGADFIQGSQFNVYEE